MMIKDDMFPIQTMVFYVKKKKLTCDDDTNPQLPLTLRKIK